MELLSLPCNFLWNVHIFFLCSPFVKLLCCNLRPFRQKQRYILPREWQGKHEGFLGKGYLSLTTELGYVFSRRFIFLLLLWKPPYVNSVVTDGISCNGYIGWWGELRMAWHHHILSTIGPTKGARLSPLVGTSLGLCYLWKQAFKVKGNLHLFLFKILYKGFCAWSTERAGGNCECMPTTYVIGH